MNSPNEPVHHRKRCHYENRHPDRLCHRQQERRATGPRSTNKSGHRRRGRLVAGLPLDPSKLNGGIQRRTLQTLFLTKRFDLELTHLVNFSSGDVVDTQRRDLRVRESGSSEVRITAFLRSKR